MPAPDIARHARSWLFAPGDSDHKMEKAQASAADVVLIDLEDAVAEDAKPAARERVAAFLDAHPEDRERLWVRINPIQSPHALQDLVRVIASAPGGIMLPKPRGRADVELAGHYLDALEAAAGREIGSTRIIIVSTETPEAMFETGRYADLPRLAAMTWGAEDIATAVGAIGNRDAQGLYDFPYQLARTLCLMGATLAGVPAIETIHGDFRDSAGLNALAAEVRRAGFRGMLAIHPAQVDPINRAFSPTEQEIERAREIVAFFAARPELGTIGHKGEMLDRPHLVRAQAILARITAA